MPHASERSLARPMISPRLPVMIPVIGVSPFYLVDRQHDFAGYRVLLHRLRAPRRAIRRGAALHRLRPLARYRRLGQRRVQFRPHHHAKPDDEEEQQRDHHPGQAAVGQRIAAEQADRARAAVRPSAATTTVTSIAPGHLRHVELAVARRGQREEQDVEGDVERHPGNDAIKAEARARGRPKRAARATT